MSPKPKTEIGGYGRSAEEGKKTEHCATQKSFS